MRRIGFGRHVLNGEQDTPRAVSRAHGLARVQTHHPATNMLEVVIDLDVFDGVGVFDDPVELACQRRDVPLPVAKRAEPYTDRLVSSRHDMDRLFGRNSQQTFRFRRDQKLKPYH